MLLVGLLTACRVVGWRVLARHSVIVISTASALVGAVTLAVGVVLKMTSRVEDVFFDGCVMGLGGSCFAISVIGIVGCKWESKCLLRMYAFALLALLAALLGVGLYLLIDGTDALSVWLDSHWSDMSQHVCSSAITSTSCRYASPLSAPTIVTRQELEELAAAHLLSITTLVVLLFLVLLVDLLMACVLQYLVSKEGRQMHEEALEMESLVTSAQDE